MKTFFSYWAKDTPEAAPHEQGPGVGVGRKVGRALGAALGAGWALRLSGQGPLPAGRGAPASLPGRERLGLGALSFALSPFFLVFFFPALA
jgi:hypothetical protein